MINNNSNRLASFAVPSLSNYVLSRIASFTAQTKITPEDIVNTTWLATSVSIAYLDWNGDRHSVSVSIDQFKQLSWKYYSEGLEKSARELIEGTDYKLAIEDTAESIEFIVNEVVLEETEAYQIPLLSIKVNKFAERTTWEVIEDLEVERFYDEKAAIAYFKSTFYSFATKFRLGETVRYRGELWTISRFGQTRAVLKRSDKNSTIFTSVTIDALEEIVELKNPEYY